MSLWNPFAFTPTGQAMAPVAPPALRVIDGQATAQQLAHAQDAYYRFCASARLSAVPNPTEIGALPDGSRYRIVVVGSLATMEVWPVGSAAEPLDRGILIKQTISASAALYTPKLLPTGGVLWSGRAIRDDDLLLPYPYAISPLFGYLNEAITDGKKYLLRLRGNVLTSYGRQRFAEDSRVILSALPPGDRAALMFMEQGAYGFRPLIMTAKTKDGEKVFAGNTDKKAAVREFITTSSPVAAISGVDFLVISNVALSSTAPKFSAVLSNRVSAEKALPWGGSYPPGHPSYSPTYINAWFMRRWGVEVRTVAGIVSISSKVGGSDKIEYVEPLRIKVEEFSVGDNGAVSSHTPVEFIDRMEDVVPSDVRVILKDGREGSVNFNYVDSRGGYVFDPVEVVVENNIVHTHVDNEDAFYDTYIGEYSREEKKQHSSKRISQLSYNRINGNLHIVSEVESLSYRATHRVGVDSVQHGRPTPYSSSTNVHQFAAFREVSKVLLDNGVQILKTVSVRAEETQECIDARSSSVSFNIETTVLVKVHNKNLLQYDPTIGMLCYVEEIVEYTTHPFRSYLGNDSGVTDVIGGRGLLPVPSIWLVVEIGGQQLRRIPISIRSDAPPWRRSAAAMRYVAVAGASPEGDGVLLQGGWIYDSSTFVDASYLDPEASPSGTVVSSPQYLWGGTTYARCSVPCMYEQFPADAAYAADSLAPAGVLRIELDEKTYTPNGPFIFLVSPGKVVDAQDVYQFTPPRGASVTPI